MGDLLRTIIQLQNGETPQAKSFPVIPLINEVWDYSRFTPPGEERSPHTALSFYGPATKENTQVENIHSIIKPNQLQLLLKECKQHQVTITNALIAAFLLSYTHHESNLGIFSCSNNLKVFC